MDTQFEFLTMDCGCKFQVVGDKKFPDSEFPRLKIDMDRINLECSKTWNLFAKGLTLGCFQLESFLGRRYSKKLKPENIEHLGALGSILRPGSLKVKDEQGVSTTDHYCLRKNKLESVPEIHPSIKSILSKTYSLIIFQEQSLQIAQKIAGFNGVEADLLRIAIAKKVAEKMAQVKHMFLEKSKQVGLMTEEEAAKLFSDIEKSTRYSFNRSLTLDTMVETKNKIKPIAELTIGEKINSPYGFIEVLDIYDHGEQEVYEAVMESGKSINCTLDHKLLCNDDKIHPLWEIIEIGLEITCQEKTERIISINKLGFRKTVDLEVNHPMHIYYANGIASENSHGISYSFTTYDTAYIKSHFPVEFYRSWLTKAKDGPYFRDRVRELIEDSKNFNIEFYPPDVTHKELTFYQKTAHNIYFGLSDVREVGQATASKLIKKIQENEVNYKSIKDWSWMDLLCLVALEINSKAVKHLAMVGAFRQITQKSNMSRRQTIKDIETITELDLREVEIEWLKNNYNRYDNFVEILKALKEFQESRLTDGSITRKNSLDAIERRISLLNDKIDLYEKPSTSMEDFPADIAKNEQYLLGYALTVCSADGKIKQRANTTLKEFALNPKQTTGVVKVHVDEVNIRVIKNGNNAGKSWAQIKISDDSYTLDNVPVFSKEWGGEPPSPTEEEDGGVQGLDEIVQAGKVIEVRLERFFKNPQEFSIKEAWDNLETITSVIN